MTDVVVEIKVDDVVKSTYRWRLEDSEDSRGARYADDLAEEVAWLLEEMVANAQRMFVSLRRKMVSSCALDCWDGEPPVDA